MGPLAPGKIFENMLQLKRFGLYFEGILNRKWLLFIKIVISATEMLGGSGTCALREKLEMINAIWCVLMYYFDQIKS